MPVIATFDDVDHELGDGETLRFGRGSAAVPVDIVVTDDRFFHACAGSLTASTDGWILSNLGSHLVLRLVERPNGGSIEVQPGRSVLCPWSHAAIEVTWRTDSGSKHLSFEVASNATRVVAAEFGADGADGGTVRFVAVDRRRTYYRVLVELCRRRLEDPANRSVPEAKEIARKLGMTPRAVEKHIEYLRTKYGFGPDRLYAESNAGMETRGTQHQMIEMAILMGDVSARDLADPVGPADLGL
jgi:hypothetical protein